MSDKELLSEILWVRISDKSGFYQAARDLIEKGKSPEPIGDLKDVKIEGDRATGEAEIVLVSYQMDRGEPEERVESKVPKSFRFRQVDGQWLLDL